MATKKELPKRQARDKYKIDGKDPNFAYKFVGTRYLSDHRSEGWVEVRKEENPDIKVMGDLRSSEKTGVIDNGTGILMKIPAEYAQEIKDSMQEVTDAKLAAVKRDCKSYTVEQISNA